MANKPKQKDLIVKVSLAAVVLIFLFCVLQIIDYSLIQPIEIKDTANNQSIEWQIEAIKVDRHYVAISGWAFIKGEHLLKYDLDVVLQNTETKETFSLPTVLDVREELNDIYDDNVDYSQTGFVARVNKRLIKFEENNYEIYLKYFHNDKGAFVQTHQIISAETGE